MSFVAKKRSLKTPGSPGYLPFVSMDLLPIFLYSALGAWRLYTSVGSLLLGFQGAGKRLKTEKSEARLFSPWLVACKISQVILNLGSKRNYFSCVERRTHSLCVNPTVAYANENLFFSHTKNSGVRQLLAVVFQWLSEVRLVSLRAHWYFPHDYKMAAKVPDIKYMFKAERSEERKKAAMCNPLLEEQKHFLKDASWTCVSLARSLLYATSINI